MPRRNLARARSLCAAGWVILAGLAGVLAAACSGANDRGLFGPGSDNNPPGQDGATTVDAASTLGSPDTGIAPTPDASTPPPPATDASLPPPPPPVDAGIDAGDDPGVRCGDSNSATYCTVPDQVCCRRTVGQGMTNTCVSANNGGGCGGGLTIPCDDTQDCTTAGMNGNVCCAQYDQNGMVTQVSCTDPSDCNLQNDSVELCNPIVSGSCPAGTACTPSTQTIPGYDICK